MEFPRWMYHAEYSGRLFATVDELLAAGDGWVNSPADLHGREEPEGGAVPKASPKRKAANGK